jgi:hypothetical protein
MHGMQTTSYTEQRGLGKYDLKCKKRKTHVAHLKYSRYDTGTRFIVAMFSARSDY